MTRWLRAALVVVAACLLGHAPDAAGAGGPLAAGFAVEDLTPSRPVPLAGYAARFGQVSDGVHDPVKARALVLDDGATKLALVSLDLVGVTKEAKVAVIDRVARRGFTSATVMLTATHTHAGPGALATVPLFRPMTGPFDRALFDEVVAKIARAIERADDALAPATLRLGATRVPGLQRNRETEGGPVDDRLRVVCVDGPTGGCAGSSSTWRRTRRSSPRRTGSSRRSGPARHATHSRPATPARPRWCCRARSATSPPRASRVTASTP